MSYRILRTHPSEVRQLVKSRQVHTWKDLAKILEVPSSDLYFYIFKNPSPYYSFEIPKRGGGVRVIHAPNAGLKNIQRRIANLLGDLHKPSTSSHGFINGRSIRSNALVHLRSQSLLNIDLENFFGSIHFGRLMGLFSGKRIGFGSQAAWAAARLCVGPCRALAQGSPCSPILSDMILKKLDRELSSLSVSKNLKYSRYADDISFSGNKECLENLVTLEVPTIVLNPVLPKLIEDNNFKINNKKTRARFLYQRREVTGIIVNKKTNLPRDFYREIRLLLRTWELHGNSIALEAYMKHHPRRKISSERKVNIGEILRGKIEHLRFVRGGFDRLSASLLIRLSRLNPELVSHNQLWRSLKFFPERYGSSLLPYLWVIDGKNRHGSGFKVERNLLVTAAHVLEKNGSLKLLHMGDPHQNYTYELVNACKHLDLAILKLDSSAEKLPHFRIKTSFQEELLKTAGFPGYNGLRQVSAYIIDTKSAQRRIVSARKEICIDMSIKSGHSGGPLLDSELNVVGICVSGDGGENATSETLNIAVCSSHLQSLFPSREKNNISKQSVQHRK